MCPSIYIDDDEFVASFYEAVERVRRAISDVREKTLALPLRFWKTERMLREFVKTLAIHNPNGAAPASREAIDAKLNSLRDLHSAIESLLADARRRGYTNRNLYAMQIRSIGRHSEEILDFIENVEIILDPDTKASFDRARDDHRNGLAVDFRTLAG